MTLRIRLARNRAGRLLGITVTKCWAFSGIYLACFFLYWLYGGISAFCLFCFAVTGMLYRCHIEDTLLYHPDSPRDSRIYVPSPSLFNLPYQSTYIKSEDGILLHIFFIAQPEEIMKTVPTVLYLHGNAGNVGHRLQNVVGLYHNMKWNVLMLEYRGYGLSEGSPSEDGLYMDARAAINYLYSKTDINTSEIIVFGRSLGGAVAIELATKQENAQKIWCLIVENTFTSIPDMAVLFTGLRFLQYLPLFVYKNKYISISKVDSIVVPTLFISGLSDEIVPAGMMEDLFNKSKSCWKKLLTFHSGTHNETWAQKGYYWRISSLMDELRENAPMRVPSTHWRIDDI